ncbi:hypothetical protein TRFO_14868 [Tritrichomonas foetus]|uniref:Surface antigen BspA-like n=1 Tax=Tritrichomonas foetus TaxID=1144522 RepID=A0A1J4KTS4_9EUKA|nr:hypothetical protein TRFO_14868 [Tritrichomonas foetus]|eukprot:OHT14689.1 hypothetical protein TRFO_14868 [Tritrichomonas foetus]
MMCSLILFFFVLSYSDVQDALSTSYSYQYNQTDLTAGVTGLIESTISNLLIPSQISYNDQTYTITSINYGAFDSNTIIHTVEIPFSVLTIHDFAFYSCVNLQNIIFDDESQLTTIGSNAFALCSSAKGNLILPNTIINIGSSAFQSCGFNGLLILPNTLSKINNFLFSDCVYFVGTLTIPKSVELIGAYAFRHCYYFTELIFEETNDNLLEIQTHAFYRVHSCTNSLILPDSIKIIGENCFFACSGFSSLHLPNNLSSLGSRGFSDCFFGGDLIIPDNITLIDEYAFYGCGGFTSLTLPENLVHIYYSSFKGCYGFKGELYIPSKVQKIVYECFQDCTGFDSLVIAATDLIEFGHSAFVNCKFSSVRYCGKFDISAISAFNFDDVSIVEVSDDYTFSSAGGLPIIQTAYLNIENICLSCNNLPNCISCSSSIGGCLQCSDGLGTNRENTEECVACNENCTKCTYEDYCTECDKHFVLIKEKCCLVIDKCEVYIGCPEA